MTLQTLNQLEDIELRIELEKCCGANNWINKMVSIFPINDEMELLKLADEKWNECEVEDWMEAFLHHPKIGDISSLKKKFANTAIWASGEQAAVQHANDFIISALAKGNQDYEEKFGFIFIVCATGKTAQEMLDLLNVRLKNTKKKELKIAAAEQAKITKIRLQKLLS